MSNLMTPLQPTPQRSYGLGGSLFLLLVSAGLAVAQPFEATGQHPYQLVLKPLTEPTLRPLTLGPPQTCTFGKESGLDNEGNPCDVWTLQVKPAQTVRLTVTSTNMDPVVRLFNTPKVFVAVPLAENDNMSGSSNALLDYELFPGRTYYVMVGGQPEGNAPGSYTLTAAAFTPPPPRPLPWDETVEGHLGPESASQQGQYCEVWTFSVTKPQVVLAALENTEAAKLNVFEGTPEAPPAAQEKQRPGLRQRIKAKPGIDYYVVVLATESEADYRLRLGPYTPPPLPPLELLPANGTVNGELTEEDPVFPGIGIAEEVMEEMEEDFRSPGDVWQVDGGKGQQVTLTCSDDLDPLLVVFDTPDFMTLSEDPDLSIDPVVANDDFGDDTDARVSFTAEPGRTYYVLVLGYEMGPYQIQVESTPLPTSAPGKPALLTPLKKLSPDEIATSTLGVEVWEFTAPEDRWVKVRMESGAFDAYVVVKSGQNGSTVIAEDDDSGGDFNAEVIFLARANQTYYIHAQMLGGGEGGAYNLKALWIEPPAEVQPDLPTSGALPGEQVWTFTAPATQRVLLQLSDLEFNPHVIVREGGPEGNVVVESPSSKTVVFQAEAGTVYYIWIGVSEGMEEEAGGME